MAPFRLPRRLTQALHVLALLASTATATAQVPRDPSFAQGANPATVTVRLTLHEPFSPWRDVTWEWRTRGSTPLVSRNHTWPDGRGGDSEVALPLPEQRDAVYSSLSACTLEPGRTDVWPGYSGDVRWAVVELEADGRSSRAAFVGDEAVRSVLPCIRSIREPADALLPTTPFRDPFWAEGTFGRIRADADVPALVWVDGRPTWHQTPVLDWPALPGRRTVRWRSLVDGTEREETVTVELGVTTSITVRLAGEATP